MCRVTMRGSGVATVGPGRACALPNIWCKPVQRCVEFCNAMLHCARRGIYICHVPPCLLPVVDS